MIQRIQTIFLLLASAAGFGVLALPFASTAEEVKTSSLFEDKIYAAGDQIGLIILFALAGLLAIGSIFLYNNRPFQVKVGWAALVANVLGIVLAGALFVQDKANIATSQLSVGLSAYLPTAFLVFTVLAIRAIKRDEALVRSADRLR